MPLSSLPAPPSTCLERMDGCLHARCRVRVSLLRLGILLAGGRRTVTSWFRAPGITHEFRAAYDTVWACGRRADRMAVPALRAVETSRPAGCGWRWTTRRPPAGARRSRGPACTTTPTRTRRRAVPLWPRLGLPRRPGPSPRAWHRRLAPAVGTLRPPQGCRCDGGGPPRRVPHQARDGRRTAGPGAGVAGPGPLRQRGSGLRRRLRQAALPTRGEETRGGRLQPAAQERRPVRPAPDASSGAARARADLRQGPHQPGAAGPVRGRLATGRVYAVRRAGDQDGRDVPGDVEVGARGDPRGDREGAGRSDPVLQHRPGGDGRGGAGGDGRSRVAGVYVRGRYGGGGGRRSNG